MKRNNVLRKFIQDHPELSAVKGAKEIGVSPSNYRAMKYRMKKAGEIAKSQLKLRLEEDIDLKEKIFQTLLKDKRTKWTIEKISDKFDCGVGRVKEIITQIRDEGKNLFVHDSGIELAKTTPTGGHITIDQRYLKGEATKFGFCTDNHLGSRYERLDVLEALYDIYEKAGITIVYNAGNMIDGEFRFNKHNLHTHGLDHQVKYLIEKYPQRKGIITYFITGDDHEGWYSQREGINVGKYIQNQAEYAGRKDLQFLGHMEADITLEQKGGSAKLRIVHPGGGSSYALSYAVQKLVESFTPGEKPNILLIGHYHKAEFLYYRGVFCIQGGTTEDQTPFMRKKRLAAHVGGWIVDYQQAPDGRIVRMKTEWMPFFDREFYQKDWEYKW